MKGVLFLLMCGFFSYSNAQSLETYALKGNVKSLHEELKICYNREDKVQTNDCSTLTSEKYFSKEGYLTVYKDPLEFENITREKFEMPTGWLETIYNNNDGVKIKIGEDYYNNDNLLLKSISYKKDIVNSYTNYYYDEKGKKIKTEKFSELNDENEKIVYYFDDFGTAIAYELFVNDEITNQAKFDVAYIFDDKGNWIQSTVINEFSTTIINRMLSYY